MKTMKTLTAAVVMGLLMAAFLTGSSSVPGAVVEAADRSVAAKVDFAHPVSLEQVIEIANNHGLRVTQLQHSFFIDDQIFTGFYPVPRGSVDTIRSAWAEAYRGFLQDAAAAARNVAEDIPDLDARTDLLRQATAFSQVHTDASGIELKVDSVFVRGEQESIQALQNASDLIYRIEIMRRRSGWRGTETQPSDESATAAAAPYAWMPQRGYVYTYPSSVSGERYSSNYMIWDSTPNFVETSTYEHDFYLNNYDGLTYLSSREDSQYRPLVTYAASSLPMPYLDTRFYDDRRELAYTIGSAAPVTIVRSYWYNNYTRIKNGNTSSDSGKLSAQLGYRSPVSCYTTWCSWPLQTEKIIPAWQIGVPGGWYWYFQ